MNVLPRFRWGSVRLQVGHSGGGYRRSKLLWGVVMIVMAGAPPVARVVAQPAGTPVEVGYRDYSFGADVSTPTGEKPENKLWWAGGIWWGSLYNETAGAYHIYRFDPATQGWIDTGTELDDRATGSTRADTLWDGQHLYVASHVFSTVGQPGGVPAHLYRYSYNSANQTYSLDLGFPVNIAPVRVEALTLAQDSTGQLWITYVARATDIGPYQVWVNHSLTSDTDWDTPSVLPVDSTAVTVSEDDISGVIAFHGSQVGVMWSNQLTSKLHFAVHADAAADDVWQLETLPPPVDNCTVACVDDHLSLRADSQGRVYAATKTSLTASDAPLVMLQVRETDGQWSSYVLGRVSDDHTRPIVMLDNTNNIVYVFATVPGQGGSVYYKQSALDAIAFDAGLGVPFIQSSADSHIGNPTSTRQNVSSSSGLLVLASDHQTHYYFHNFIGIAAPPGGAHQIFLPVMSR